MHLAIAPLVAYVPCPLSLVPYPMCAVLHRTCPRGPSQHMSYKQCTGTTLVSGAAKLGEIRCLEAGHFCCAFVSFNIRFNFDM